MSKFSFRTTASFYWGMGFFSTSQILAIVMGGRVIALYSICLFLVIVHLAFYTPKTKPIYDKSLKHLFLGWMIISLVSGVFGLAYFADYADWVQRILGYFPKIIMYLILFYLMSRDKYKERHINLIVSGLKYGILLNVVWSILDAITYYTMGYSLTNNTFSSYIAAKDIRYGMLSLTQFGFIRSGGLNADPANLGMFATMLAAYAMLKKKYWLLLLAIGSALASVSFIAILGIIIVFCYHFFSQVSATGFKIKQLLPILGVLLLVCYFLSSDNESIVGALSGVSERLETKEDLGTSDVRTQYWLNFLPAMFSSPIYWFIGTGYMTASYPYLINKLVTHEFEPYDPENTYFSNFFDFGLIGVILFISFYIKVWSKYKNAIIANDNEFNIAMLSLIEGTLIAFGGYHYTLYSVVLLFSICAVLHIENNATKNRSKKLVQHKKIK